MVILLFVKLLKSWCKIFVKINWFLKMNSFWHEILWKITYVVITSLFALLISFYIFIWGLIADPLFFKIPKNKSVDILHAQLDNGKRPDYDLRHRTHRSNLTWKKHLDVFFFTLMNQIWLSTRFVKCVYYQVHHFIGDKLNLKFLNKSFGWVFLAFNGCNIANPKLRKTSDIAKKCCSFKHSSQ